MPLFSKSRYTPLINQSPSQKRETSSRESLSSQSIPSADDSNAWEAGSVTPQTYKRTLTVINLILFSISVTLFLHRLYGGSMSRNWLLKQTSFYSPVLDRVDIPTSPIQIDGALFTPDNPSIYRQEPSPEVDAAWVELELIRAIPISADDVVRLGKDPSIAARFPEDIGFGPDAYMAQIDVFHQIHCVNVLRRLSVKALNHTKLDLSPSRLKLQELHISHCSYILLENLMCNANVDLITFNWMETQERPFPDFNIKHQCRDFETVRRWQENNAIEMEKWIAMKKPEDAISIPAPQGYYDTFGISKDEP